MKPFIIITGMHRSGTSFLARALNLHGVYLGDLDSLLSHEWRAFEDNPKGHWENKKIYELAEKTLEYSKGSWHDVPKEIHVNSKIGAEIKKCTNQLAEKSILASGFKDPRILLCLDSWRKYLPKNFIIVGIFRHPLKVAESLKKRNNFSYEKSLNLWKIYNQILLDILAKNGGFLLDFDWPKKKLLDQTNLIARKLGLAKNIDLSDWYTEELLISDKTFKKNYSLPNDIKLLYSNLLKKSHRNQHVKIEKIKPQSEEFISTISNLLTQIQNQGKYFNDILNEHEKKSKKNQKQLIKLQNEVEKLSKLELELDKQLDQRGETITNLKKDYEEQQQKFQELSQKLEGMENAIQTKDSQILNFQNEIEKLQSELNEIKNSVMYGITSNIARKLDKIAPASTRRRNTLRLTSAAYLMKKERGTKALMGVAKEKMKKSVSKSKSQIEPKWYLKTIKEKKPKFIQNVIKIEEKFEPDHSLRQFIEFGSHNIIKINKFPKISIIIITFNQVNALKRNLESIKSKSTYQNYEIIIVTNNQDENSEMRNFLKTVSHQVYVFEDEYSFGGMNNFGASKVNGEFLLFLNDDVEVLAPNWLEAFLSSALDESVGVVGPKLLSSNGKLQDCGGIVWANGKGWNYGRTYDSNDPIFNYVRDVDYVSGSCLFVKKAIFEQVGGFDRRFDPSYWEDTDLCFSIKKLGYRILYQPLARLTHYEGMTQGVSTDSGLKSYQIPNQKKFEEKWRPVLDTHLDDSIENSFFERNRRSGLNILYIDHYVPEPEKDSGSLRTFGILGILAHMENKITFWPENQKHTEPYVAELQQKGIEVIYNTRDFDRFLEERKHLYDVAILARPYISVKFVDLIIEKMPNCKIIYDTIDLHFLRMSRQASLQNKGDNSEAEVMRKLEFSLMRKSAVTILTSPAEAEFLHDEEPSLKFAILPNIHTEHENVAGFDGRKNMFFLGGFQHMPNIDSAKYLVHDIWPIIKHKVPDAKLYIVGSSPTDEIKKLASNGIVVTGFVKDLSPYYDENKVMLVPLRFGSGIKGKITQSLAMGMPVITTSIGAEGINLVDGDSCMIANTKEDFAEKAIQVYSDKKLWQKLSQNGLTVAKDYSPERTRACLETLFSTIL